MRTNLVEGLIIGCGIGIVVLVARWLFHGAVLVEGGAILLGGVALAVAQILISRYLRRRQAQRAVAAPAEPEEPPTAPLISPNLGWSDGPVHAARAPSDVVADRASPPQGLEEAHAERPDSAEPQRLAGNDE
jgi:hypothetical protein